MASPEKLIRDWRIQIWVVALVASLIAMGINLNTKGAYVTYVDKSSPFYGMIRPGFIIREINGTSATPEMVMNFNGTYAEIRTNRGTYYSEVNGSLGISAKSVPLTNLRFGLDLEGGVRAILKVKGDYSRDTLDQIISILQTRINLYGLRETNFRPIYTDGYIELEMAGGTINELKDLLEKQGLFEAVIPVNVSVPGTLEFNGKQYEVALENQTVLVDGEKREEIDGVPFRVIVNNGTITFQFIVFTGSDIKTIYTDPQRSYIRRQSGGYAWGFQVLLDSTAADRFAKATRSLDVVFDRGGYLSSPIEFYLDGNLTDSLRISSSLRGRPETQPMITGFGATLEDAKKNKKNLESILRSGALPAPIEIISTDTISPKLGTRFISEAVLAGIVSIILISLLVFIYYKHLEISIPVILSSFSETLMILGTASVIGWTIDLPSIAGLLTALGASITDQVMMVDELEHGKKERLSLKERIKRALFIIFGSAGISAASMIPLFSAGFGVLKGYAVTTLLGIAISNFIARPAFNRAIEVLSEGETASEKEETDMVSIIMVSTLFLASIMFVFTKSPQNWLIPVWMISVFIWFGFLFFRLYTAGEETPGHGTRPEMK